MAYICDNRPTDGQMKAIPIIPLPRGWGLNVQNGCLSPSRLQVLSQAISWSYDQELSWLSCTYELLP